MKFTGGTWKYAPDLSAVVVIKDHEVKAVADFGKTIALADDALVMAAAKELFAVVDEVFGTPEKWGYNAAGKSMDDDVRARALAALAKAKGEE